MRHARVFLLVVLVLALLTTACGAQATGTQVPESALTIIDRAAAFIPEVNLPPVVVTYSQEGVPSILGIRTTDITRFTGVDLSFLELDAVFIDWFTRSNLQHIAIEHNQDGLLVYANGQLLPSIGWSAESLNNSIELADMLGAPNTAVVQRLVPVLQKLGIGVVLRFPVAAGNSPIPLHQPGTRLPAPSDVAEGAAVIQLAVEYREDGLPTIMGLTSRDISALTGFDLSPVELSSDNIGVLKAMNLQSVEVETKTDGLRIYLNGKELPRLAYSPAQITALVNLYGQMYPGYQPPPQFLQAVFMTIQQADLDLIVQFPVAAEAERLPLHYEMTAGN